MTTNAYVAGEIEVDRTDYTGPTVSVGAPGGRSNVARILELEQRLASVTAELAAVRPVYDAAVAWRRTHGSSVEVVIDGKRLTGSTADDRALRLAVDRAVMVPAVVPVQPAGWPRLCEQCGRPTSLGCSFCGRPLCRLDAAWNAATQTHALGLACPRPTVTEVTP